MMNLLSMPICFHIFKVAFFSLELGRVLLLIGRFRSFLRQLNFKYEMLLNNLVPIPSAVSDYISSLPIKVSPAVGITRKLIEQKLMRSIGI